MGEMRNAYKIVIGKHERGDHSQNLSTDGRIILKGKVWIGFWLSDKDQGQSN
jgi:hypothetical protein